MLPWWGWALLWLGLVLGGVLLVGLRVRGLWRSAKALGSEVARASETVAALEAEAGRLRATGDDTPTVTAVTQHPHRVREEHRARRRDQAALRSARRAERMPPWARVD